MLHALPLALKKKLLTADSDRAFGGLVAGAGLPGPAGSFVLTLDYKLERACGPSESGGLRALLLLQSFFLVSAVDVFDRKGIRPIKDDEHGLRPASIPLYAIHRSCRWCH